MTDSCVKPFRSTCSRISILLFIIFNFVYVAAGASRDVSFEECDILIVGGGTGGVAAALQACRMADEFGIRKIILTEQTDWLGGQWTAQGVTACDPNALISSGRYDAGASELYLQLDEAIRDFYRPRALETARKTSRTGSEQSQARKLDIQQIEGRTFSPGNPWSSRMSFLPIDCVKAIDGLIEPFLKRGLLKVSYNLIPIDARKDGNRVTGIRFRNQKTGEETLVAAHVTLDATELGDLFPLSGAAYRVGIESSYDTREPSLFDEDGKALYPEPCPECTQAFTYVFAVEWRPVGEDHRRPWETRPKSYEQNRYRYTLLSGERRFLMTRRNEFAKSQNRQGVPPFWTYRRMLDASYLDSDLPLDLYAHFLDDEWKTELEMESNPQYFIPNPLQANVGDIAGINWASNDYAGESIIDVPDDVRDQILERARELSLGFLYYLWHEVPRDPSDSRLDPSKEENWSVDPATGKRRGYANLRFRPDVMGTEEGLGKFPYIRESRRVRALRTVVQQDLLGPSVERAELFHDSVGIGHYYSMDIHPCDMGQPVKRDVRFKRVKLRNGQWARESNPSRFQIPWSAMIPEEVDGLIPAAKNIGTTHISASAYRLHPVEFQVGQAAGAAAVFCVASGCQPRDLWVPLLEEKPTENEKKLRRLQVDLLRRRVPLFWNEDCGWDSDLFEAVQFVCVLGILEPGGARHFRPDSPVTRAEMALAVMRLARSTPPGTDYKLRFDDIPAKNKVLADALNFLETRQALGWIQGSKFQPEEAITYVQALETIEQALMSGKVRSGRNPHEKLTRGEAAKILYEELLRIFGLD